MTTAACPEWLGIGFCSQSLFTQVAILILIFAGVLLLHGSRHTDDPVHKRVQRIAAVGVILGPLVFFGLTLAGDGVLF